MLNDVAGKTMFNVHTPMVNMHIVLNWSVEITAQSIALSYILDWKTKSALSHLDGTLKPLKPVLPPK